MRSVVQWALGKGALYILLVLALVLAPLVSRTLGRGNLRDELMSPREISRHFELQKAEAVRAFGVRRAEISSYSASRLTARLSAARSDLASVRDQLAQTQGGFASITPSGLLDRRRLELRQTALEGEIRLLDAAARRQALDAELDGLTLPAPAMIAAARRGCDAANAEARRFNSRNALERSVRNVLAAEARRLSEAAKRSCAEHRRLVGLERSVLARAEELKADLIRAQSAYDRAGRDAEAAMRAKPLKLSTTLRSLLIQAALLLLGIIAAPYGIRLIFYYALAPLAQRRPAIRLGAASGLQGPSLTRPLTSTTSAAIRLADGEEVLVRQGFLQSTARESAASTQVLLNWRHPLSSWASGLVFLTRIRGEGQTTVVSATRDPFAELTVLEIPAGSACVLHPRALAAVVQPAGQPVRITTHWRLGSLHAWLTLQLRYLMFHGPARLVIKGARGVRAEPAQAGRLFGQGQLVGFSPDLAYSVTRTETFWPYFLGIEALFKDRVDQGTGFLILEEAPLTGHDGARPRKGLEGAADVLLKAVGL